MKGKIAKRLILGVHVDTHDTGAALLLNGEVLAAVNEERFSRIKEDSQFPSHSIAEVLRIGGVDLEDLSQMAISGFPPSMKKLFRYGLDDWKKMVLSGGAGLFSFAIREANRSLLRNVLHFFPRLIMSAYEHIGLGAMVGGVRIMAATRRFIRRARRAGFQGSVHYVPHNICHLATTYQTSGFDQALLINIEGSSFEYTTDIATGEDGTIGLVKSTPVPHSAGEFYKLITAILGFSPRRHAGKITGLAAYGDPEKAYSLVEPLLGTNDDMTLRIHGQTYRLMAEYRRHRRIPPYFAGHSREDLSAAFQRRLEVVCCSLVEKAIAVVRPERLSLCGGVAANVKMNQRLAALSGIDEIFVHPGMGDVGQALGAALAVASGNREGQAEEYRPRRLKNVFWGPEYTEEQILHAISEEELPYERQDSIECKTAELLAAGKVVARFSGRMEYGPRALGNRSILYRPDDHSVNDWLNKRLKRTEFMPFAPATLAQFAEQCYRDIRGKEYTAEFMTITCDCTDWMKKTCPGVVHVDGTARPQLVTEEANPGFYRILKEFHRRTGIPSVINTSFNMHEEPIVCTPLDAIRTFLLGHLDHLAIGPFLLTQRG